MSGIVSAFKEHATFEPTKTKLSASETYWAISDLIELHSNNCNLKEKIKITGYKNLNEFCKSHKDVFLKAAINYNADIALREISLKLPSFLYHRDTKITSKSDRLTLHTKVAKVITHLKNKKWPLILVYRHVTTVISHKIIKKNNKVSEVVFSIYDSNYKNSRIKRIKYSSDGLPAAGQRMFWDVTPQRNFGICKYTKTFINLSPKNIVRSLLDL